MVEERVAEGRPRRGPTMRATVWCLVTVLVGLVAVSALATGLARLRVADEVRELADRLLPAQQATTALVVALVDQETGQRGYSLTGDPTFLEPYVTGRAGEAEATTALAGMLRADPVAGAELRAVTAGAAQWRAEVAEPTIAARRAGAVTAAQAEVSERRGKELFDVLRQRLRALEQRTASEAQDAIAATFSAQATANVVAVTATVLAVGVAVVSVPLVRRRLIRPLADLEAQAERTAAGAYTTPIALIGPGDVTTIGDAVETMRTSLLRHGAELTDARLELALRDARDRLSAEVHDNSIQRLFALGLTLQGVARDHPAAQDDLDSLADEIDDIVGELRELIANLVRTEVSAATLREQMFDVVRDSGRALGITPALEVRGPVDDALTDDLARELLAVLRECLVNIARHASAPSAAVRLVVDAEGVTLRVEDEGVGVPRDIEHGEGLTVAAARAERFGGTLSVAPRPGGGTLVSWWVPRPQEVGERAGRCGSTWPCPGA
ncbi:CHASE3 domain-containing protein [Actinomycetospora lutea]|uniref:CHASE3 domain-containing protein n=1 Tax=Actinomycetospora lutea TaxID=663604 RepID=UPI00236560CF|nr:CHASE3 domain-containing protein [Actinomycetospora lutea]MDD7939629.1 CHASE3 domain-containing protein [Actinomycetospora lutea]